jgi:hypothetical protein
LGFPIWLLARDQRGLFFRILTPLLKAVPEVSARLKEPNSKDEPFEDLVKSAQDAAVLVLVY